MKTSLIILVLGAVAAVSACSSSDETQTPAAGTEAPERGVYQAGKYDMPGSCEGSCGTYSADGCYCDPACVGWGDCCEDFAQVCEGDPQEWSCGVKCESADDCNPNEPYCDRDTGVCQQEPPQCVTDDDCDDENIGDFCRPDGYCSPMPYLNCRPGWDLFEGECGNAACVQDECPAGTSIDEETCYCEGTRPAPSCTSADECPAVYPYCNRELGKCQQEPPQCSATSQCAEGQWCGFDGYCSDVPAFNCRPGYTLFEGACDNAACTAEA